MRTKILALGAAAVMLMAVACDEAEPTPDPALAFCDSVETLGESVVALESLGLSATVEDVEAGVEAVSAAAAEVKDSAGDLAESQAEAIEDAVGELQGYRDSIEDTQTIEEVLAGLAEQVAAVKAARVEAGTVHCGLEEAEAAVDEVEAEVEAAATEKAEMVEDTAEEVQAEVEDAAGEAEDAAEDVQAEVEDAAGEASEEMEEKADEASE